MKKDWFIELHKLAHALEALRCNLKKKTMHSIAKVI